MNKTKTIYFLSAVVLIIGCYALNLSYSLFVQTEEKEIVNSVVPYLDSELSLTSLEVEAGKEYLIKQTVSNTGTADMNYAINVNSSSTTYTVQAVNDGTNTYTSTGTLSANTTKDLYFVVTNTGTGTITIDFTIDKNYTTLINNLTTNIDNDNLYLISLGIPYKSQPESLAYHIIDQYVNSKLYTGTANEDLSNLFTEDINKIELPITPKLNINEPDLSNVATSELGLFHTEDDYGTSYYFRGTSSVNYVEFNNMCWRIVRIEGDGSIKITLAAQKKCSEITDSDTGTAAIGTGNYGYTYDYVTNSSGATSTNKKYVADYVNGQTSSMKYKLDAWLTSSGIDTSKLKKDEWCLGNTIDLYDTSTGALLTDKVNDLMYNSKSFTYDTLRRLKRTDTTAYATLRCDGNNYETHESYIGALTADEAIFAGGKLSTANSNYYLTDNATSIYWWTLSPSSFDGLFDYAFYVNGYGYVDFGYDVHSVGVSLRPAVTLASSTVITGGNGTQTNPYIVE